MKDYEGVSKSFNEFGFGLKKDEVFNEIFNGSEKMKAKEINLGSIRCPTGNKYCYACPSCSSNQKEADLKQYDSGGSWDLKDKQMMETWECPECKSQYMFIYDLSSVTQTK